MTTVEFSSYCSKHFDEFYTRCWMFKLCISDWRPVIVESGDIYMLELAFFWNPTTRISTSCTHTSAWSHGLSARSLGSSPKNNRTPSLDVECVLAYLKVPENPQNKSVCKPLFEESEKILKITIQSMR